MSDIRPHASGNRLHLANAVLRPALTIRPLWLSERTPHRPLFGISFAPFLPDQERDRVEHELSKRIDAFIANAYIEEKADPEYQESFAREGSRKAEYAVHDLRYREAEGLLRLRRLAYLCIGGADGSEVEYVLAETAISKAIMIEVNSEGVAAARERVQRLAEHGKEFVVLQGDATAMLEDALAIAESWCTEGSIEGLVLSAQGVLHELPARSPGFDLPVFLGKVFRHPDWRVCAFYSREPCKPAGWPDVVRVRIPGLPAKDLARMAQYVRDRLRMTGKPEMVGTGWVDLPTPLAIETLHKLIRGGSIRRIGYELGEQLTGFDPIAVKNDLQKLVDHMHVTVDQVTTSGFREALRNFAVEYEGHNSESLPVPKTHSEIIGFVCKVKPAPEETSPKGCPFASSATADGLKFSNPFASEVADSEILNWLEQFEPSERPLICRLLDDFTFISHKQLLDLSARLHKAVAEELGGALERAWYVPLGGVAKSGGLVAYHYRTQNGLPSDRFLSPDEIRQKAGQGDPIVLLDDLLASGHQALHELERMQGTGAVPKTSRAVLATLVSCEAGRTFVEDRSDLRSVSALRLSRSQEPLSSDSKLFPEIEDRNRLREILEKYAKVLGTSMPFGYAGSGLLLAFYYATPDNSLPIFWADSPHWRSIMSKRTPPRQLVTTMIG